MNFKKNFLCDYYHKIEGVKKSTLAENIDLIYWPIDPWLTLDNVAQLLCGECANRGFANTLLVE